MSELGIDPIAAIGDVPQDAAREHIAALVKGDAISVEAANAALAAKGFAGLNTNSVEYYATRKEAMLNDPEFAAAYTCGDAGAISGLYELDLRISQASGRLTDRPLAASDAAYDGVRRAVANNVPDADGTYANEMSGLTSSLGMPADNSATLANDHFAALRDTADMDADAKQLWGDQQAAAFTAALGGEGAEEKITAASKALSEKSGRKLDLNAIARSNGVRVAVNLYFQSQTLTTRK